MELNCVASWRNGDGVAEIAVPFSGVKSGDLRPRFGILVDVGAPLDEVIVPAPVCAVGIYKTRLMGGKPDRLQLSRRTRGKFQRTHECRPPPTRKELQVELAVCRWVHILENTYVDRGGTGVRDRIEVHQQRMPVQVYLEMAAILGVLLLVYIRLPEGIGEIEPQLVNA